MKTPESVLPEWVLRQKRFCEKEKLCSTVSELALIEALTIALEAVRYYASHENGISYKAKDAIDKIEH